MAGSSRGTGSRAVFSSRRRVVSPKRCPTFTMAFSCCSSLTLRDSSVPFSMRFRYAPCASITCAFRFTSQTPCPRLSSTTLRTPKALTPTLFPSQQDNNHCSMLSSKVTIW